MSSRSSPAPPSSPWRVNIRVEAWSPHFLFCRGRIFVQDARRDVDQHDDDGTTTKTTTFSNNGSSPIHNYLRPNEPVIAVIDEEALRKKLVQEMYQRSSSSTSEFSSLHRDHYSNADYSSAPGGLYEGGSYVEPGVVSTHTTTSSNATYSSGENIAATLLQPDTLISVHYSHVFPVPSGVDGSHAEHDELRPGEVQENLQTARARSSSLLSQLESTVAGLELLARLPVGALEEDILLVANHRAAMGVVRALEVVRRAGFDAGVAGTSTSDGCSSSGTSARGVATSSPRFYQTHPVAGLTVLTESGSSFAEDLRLRQDAAPKCSAGGKNNSHFFEVVELPRRNNNSPGEIQQRAENTAGGGSGIITSATSSSNSALLIPESLQTRRFKTILYCGLNLESACRNLSSATSSSSTPSAEHNPSFVRQLFALLSSSSTEQHRDHFYHSGFTPSTPTFVVLTRSFELAPIECQYLISKNVSLLFHRCFGSSGSSTSSFGASAGSALVELVKKALYNDKAFLSSCTTNTPNEQEAKHDDHHAPYQQRSLRQFSFEDASTEVWHCG
ncbi:unnamed protein product [Amoebophrya sp. A120]|nr:unnamed protein product [Amoebophrya sp. A120]|eukprot:GSA120T00016270001.1